MNADYAFPRLVRVQWKNRSTGAVRSFVAHNVAENEQHALDIGDAIMTCMVPEFLPLAVRYQVALLSRAPNVRDMHARETPWETINGFQLNMARAISAPKKRARR